MAVHASTLAIPPKIDLVRLAMGLMKTLDVEELLNRALDTLAEATPNSSWALFVGLGPRRFQVAVRGSMDAGTLRG